MISFAHVGIELRRACRRWRVTCPALSVARRGPISTIATFPEAPLFIPDGRISRVRLATLACPLAGLPDGDEAQALARIRPCRRRFARGLAPQSAPTRPGSKSGCRTRPRNRQAPRAPSPLRGVTSPGAASGPPGRALPLRHSSYGLMRRTESLPPASVVPIPTGPRRLPPAPAGRRPFPALSPRSLHGCPDPYPAAPGRCTCPFLPDRLRPRPRTQKLGTPNIRRAATSHGGLHFGAAVIRLSSDHRAR